MKSERLFRLLGLIDESLIEEAACPLPSTSRRMLSWKPLLTAAACVAVICMVSIPFMLRGNAPKSDAEPGGISGGDTGIHTEDSAAPGTPSAPGGTTFMSYAGPVFPLTVLNPTEGLTAERTTTWDFSPSPSHNGALRQWGAEVTDSYMLMNHTTGEILALISYPVAGSFADSDAQLPVLTVGEEETDWTLNAGAYAGGFRDAGEGDGSSWNLDPPDSWTDYKALLSDGSYQAEAFSEYQDLSTPVTVYSFTDQKVSSGGRNPTQAVFFSADPEQTTILSYGFNGMSIDHDRGEYRYSYSGLTSTASKSKSRLLILLGEDITDYTLQGYEDGGCDPGEELAGVSCTVTRSESTLGEVLNTLCAQRLGSIAEGVLPAAFSLEMYQGAAAQFILQHGLLSAEGAKDRYSNGRLDEILEETLSLPRILYLTTEIVIPAGESVKVTLRMEKEPSYDYHCSGSDKHDVQGYGFTTTLGSTLEFTSQTAALTNAGGIEIMAQNFGFDLSADITEVPLDPTVEHYYLEIRPLS